MDDELLREQLIQIVTQANPQVLRDIAEHLGIDVDE